MTGQGREEPIEHSPLSTDCKSLRHSLPIPQCVEAPLGLGASESTEVLLSGGAVVRCQCREDPLLADRCRTSDGR
jgi:hypothetical protein